MLIQSTAWNYAELSHFVNPFNELLRPPSAPVTWSLDTVAGLTSISEEIRRQAQMIGYLNAFRLFAIAAALAIPICFLFSDPRGPDTARER